MSLYFGNEERLDPKLTDPKKVKKAPECPLQKKIWELRKHFEEVGWPLKFKYRTDIGLKLESGETLLPGRKSLANKCSVTTENGAEVLIYSERERRNSDGYLEYFPPKVYFTNEHYVNENEWDRAVFIYLSKIEGKNYSSIILEDLECENRKRGEEIKIQSKVSNIIMNPNSFKLTPEKFAKLIESYGLTVTKDMTTNQLALLDKLAERKLKDHLVYSKFLKTYNDEAKIEIMQNVNKGMEKAVIEYSEGDGKVWRYVVDGKPGNVITSCNKSATNKEELADFFVDNPSKYEAFEGVLKSVLEKAE